MLDVRRLRILREVAARGSFSAAAESLNFTQSAVSQHIAALEREAGARLVEREPRGVRMTEAGSALVAHAEAVIARLEAAEEELEAIAGLRGGRLRLASFQSGNATLVPRAVAAFRRRHPDVELSLVEAEPTDALARLAAREVDLALTYDGPGVTGAQDDGVESEHLVDDPYDAILPRGHALARRRAIRLEELEGEPWIMASDRCDCRSIVTRACEESGFTPEAAFETDENISAQAFVAAGVGVCLLPRLALSTLHPGVVAVRLRSGGPVRSIHATRTAGGYRSPASRAMVETLRAVAEDFRGAAAPLAAIG